jgi:hypothetical protein
VMRGETVEARFKSVNNDWLTACPREGYLAGWSSYDKIFPFIDDNGDHYQFCQVYDPPEWFVNKPDPGEGWRLLGKFPHEAKLGTDEAWAYHADCWQVVQNDNGVQEKTTWYRRRIANNPASSDSSRSRDTIPSGWRLLGKDEERLASDAYWSLVCKEWIVIGDDRVKYANELDKWHAIRQVDHQADYALLAGFSYPLPNGQTIRVTEKGLEVL